MSDLKMETVRERNENREMEYLSPLAALSARSRGREQPDVPCNYRTEYQRDRDRILHCKSFRRLKHKTQVFLSPEGDHYRTRLTHTLEVSQIARTVARALSLNEDLTEAIALGHDLGHTPFGHAGERALEKVMTGGFRHYEQSVRTAQRLEKDGQGLNLTWETCDGILNHTTGSHPATMEGEIVRMSDRVAYLNHDLDDAVRAGILSENDVPADIREMLGGCRTIRINTLVTAMIEQSETEIGIGELKPYYDKLHKFMFDAVYFNPVAKGEEKKVDGLIESMFSHFIANPHRLPDEYRCIADTEGLPRAVCDYIAGMTDNYALAVYGDLFIPQHWTVQSL